MTTAELLMPDRSHTRDVPRCDAFARIYGRHAGRLTSERVPRHALGGRRVNVSTSRQVSEIF